MRVGDVQVLCQRVYGALAAQLADSVEVITRILDRQPDSTADEIRRDLNRQEIKIPVQLIAVRNS